MVELRKENPVLVYGKYDLLQKEHAEIYAYTRTLGDDKMLILLNFSDKKSTIHLEISGNLDKTLINNYDILKVTGTSITLEPYQSVIQTIK